MKYVTLNTCLSCKEVVIVYWNGIEIVMSKCLGKLKLFEISKYNFETILAVLNTQYLIVFK